MTTFERPPIAPPRLIVTACGPPQTRTVVLVLPGGRAHSLRPSRAVQLANLRMIPFAWAARRQVRGLPIAVWRLRHRVRGWNSPVLDPVRDVNWALDEVRRRHPGAQVLFIGHSMGGRTALRCAGDPSVAGVCALAPWIESGEPYAQLGGRTVLIAHGDQDRVTEPQMSQEFAELAARTGADVRFQPMPGDGHGMVRHARRWNILVRRFIADLAGARGADSRVADARATDARATD